MSVTSRSTDPAQDTEADRPKLGVLSGYTIGVTADRRSHEQISLLAGRGASCIHGPTIRTHPLRPENEIRAVTEALLSEPPDIVVATTGIGMRGWFEAADALLIGEDLRLMLSRCRIFSRGPKAHGAAVTAGMEVEWSAPMATTAEVVERLAMVITSGTRVAIQVDGAPDHKAVKDLEQLGAEVIAVPVYRWSLPDLGGPAEVLLQAIADRRVDGVTFTARPAVENFADIAERLGLFESVQAAMKNSVKVFCVGPVCAQGVLDLDLGQPIQPERPRLGALIMTLTSIFATQNADVRIGGYDVRLQGRSAQVSGQESAMLTVRERQVMDVLVERPGVVQSKEHLLKKVWGSDESDLHVVEVTMGRLRRRLGPAGVGIETVMRRGYRVSPD